jgi:hypothetical protein
MVLQRCDGEAVDALVQRCGGAVATAPVVPAVDDIRLTLPLRSLGLGTSLAANKGGEDLGGVVVLVTRCY